MEDREEVKQDTNPEAPGGPGGPGIEGQTSGGSGGAVGEPTPGERDSAHPAQDSDSPIGGEDAGEQEAAPDRDEADHSVEGGGESPESGTEMPAEHGDS